MKAKTEVVIETPSICTSVKALRVKAEFVSAYGAYSTATDKLDNVFGKAYIAISGGHKTKAGLTLLRNTLVAWLIEAKVKEDTAKGAVSGLMLRNEMYIKGKQDSHLTGARKQQVQSVIKWVRGEFSDLSNKDIVNLLQAAMRQLRKAAK